MRLHRWIAASLIAAPLGIFAAPQAHAGILGCSERNPNAPANAEAGQNTNDDHSEAPFLSLSDGIDIITINPKAAIAIEEDGRAETEGSGTSASPGETRAAQSENEGAVEESCLVRGHDLVDVLTINPEISLSLDDDPLIFEKSDERRDAQPAPQR